jgi:hypothetical protein
MYKYNFLYTNFLFSCTTNTAHGVSGALMKYAGGGNWIPINIYPAFFWDYAKNKDILHTIANRFKTAARDAN